MPTEQNVGEFLATQNHSGWHIAGRVEHDLTLNLDGVTGGEAINIITKDRG